MMKFQEPPKRATASAMRSPKVASSSMVGGLVEHGGEAEEAAVLGLVDEDFLLVFVDGGDADVAGHEDIGGDAGFADLEDALARGELSYFDVGGEDGGFFFVEEFEQRNVFQLLWIAGHGGLFWLRWVQGNA
jgi:hypothetical protein